MGKKSTEDLLVEIMSQEKAIEFIEVYKSKRMTNEDEVNFTVEYLIELILVRRFLSECGLDKDYKKYLKGVKITGIDGDKFEFEFNEIN